MANRSRMTGARDIANSLNQIGRGLNQPINAASRKALRPMLNQAKANLKANGNVESGEFLKLLTIKRDPKSRADRPTHMVGPDAKKSPGYRKGHLIEFGTAPHWIGNRFHRGARAFPFLRPAFEATKDVVIQILGREIGPELEKQAARVAKKAAKK